MPHVAAPIPIEEINLQSLLDSLGVAGLMMTKPSCLKYSWESTVMGTSLKLVGRRMYLGLLLKQSTRQVQTWFLRLQQWSLITGIWCVYIYISFVSFDGSDLKIDENYLQSHLRDYGDVRRIMG